MRRQWSAQVQGTRAQTCMKWKMMPLEENQNHKAMRRVHQGLAVESGKGGCQSHHRLQACTRDRKPHKLVRSMLHHAKSDKMCVCVTTNITRSHRKDEWWWVLLMFALYVLEFNIHEIHKQLKNVKNLHIRSYYKAQSYKGINN
jgi:hypothetical protein